MATVSLAALCDALDATCREALERAALACAGRGEHEVRIDDHVEALLSSKDMQDILRQFERNPERLQEHIYKSRPPEGRHTGRPAFSPLLYQLLQEAYLLATLELGRTDISAGVLMLALLQNPVRYGILSFYAEIRGISAEGLRTLLEGLWEEKGGSAPTARAAEGQALAQYATDFTEEARQNKIDPVFARGTEIRLMADILTRRRKNNPILVGDPGVGKTAVVEGLALKIVRHEVPDALRGVRLAGLDMGRLQAGASVKGEFERRLKAVIDEVKASPVPTILFIDEAHTLVGSGNTAGSGDGANLLKPALARGELRTIAATTWSEYKKYFEKDAALARRFQLVRLDEPTLPETVTILRGIVPHYEAAHGVYVRDDAVLRTAELAGRYITGRHLPDKAIDVLDTACARVRVSLGARPAALESVEEELAAQRRELDAVERDCSRSVDSAPQATAHAALRARMDTLSEEAAVLEARWRKELDLVRAIVQLRQGQTGEGGVMPEQIMLEEVKSKQTGEQADEETGESLVPPTLLPELLAGLARVQQGAPLVFHEVSPALVTDIVAEWTGIPAGKLDGGGSAALQSLGERLRQRIRGQNPALETIEKTVRTAHAGLDSPTRPTGVFLLAGPSGVGKTETALAVAEALFGGESALISINMSEFQEKHTISRLIGSPPGYVGYGEGGRLTEAVRRQPYAAVLFDEVEKAHPDVLQLFYQLFDKGVLADGEGREVDFRNTIIFLTSNLGGDVLSALAEEGSAAPEAEVARQAVQPLLLQHFRPALLGRMTVVPYMPLSADIIQELVEMKLGIIAERLLHRHRITLAWDKAVVENITHSCDAVDTGARNIDHIINTHLLPETAAVVLRSLSEDTKPGRCLRVGLNPSGGAFTCIWDTPEKG